MVEIIWNDTNIPASQGWMSETEHDQWASNGGAAVRSVGIFINQDKNFIRLVGDVDADPAQPPNFLRPINIGRGYIHEIHILRRK